MTMTEIVLRVRLISGEYLDVTYDEADGTAGKPWTVSSRPWQPVTARCAAGASPPSR
jgi:hypothetical protein